MFRIGGHKLNAIVVAVALVALVRILGGLLDRSENAPGARIRHRVRTSPTLPVQFVISTRHPT